MVDRDRRHACRCPSRNRRDRRATRTYARPLLVAAAHACADAMRVLRRDGVHAWSRGGGQSAGEKYVYVETQNWLNACRSYLKVLDSE